MMREPEFLIIDSAEDGLSALMVDGGATSTMTGTAAVVMLGKRSQRFSTKRVGWMIVQESHRRGGGTGIRGRAIHAGDHRSLPEVAPADARLCLVSCEKFPIDPESAKEMLLLDGAA